MGKKQFNIKSTVLKEAISTVALKVKTQQRDGKKNISEKKIYHKTQQHHRKHTG